MGHPSRAAFIEELQQQLAPAPLSVDTGFGIVENCARAWELYDPRATHHVVIQDDALVCRDFRARAEAFIERMQELHGHEDRAISFYYGTRKRLLSAAAEAMKVGYAMRVNVGWGVAICLPTRLVPELVASIRAGSAPQDDERMNGFIRSRGMRIYYPMPSLVDHRRGPSLVGNGDDRQAFAFIDRK